MKKILMTAILVFLLVAGNAAIGHADDPPTVNAKSPLGTNLQAPSYYNTSLPFKNLIKCASPWQLWNKSTYVTTVMPSTDLDGDGYPTSIPSGYWALVYLGLGAFGHYPSGEYVALYDGEGTLDFAYDASNVVKAREGRYTFHVSTTTNSGILCWMKATTPGNHIHNLRVLPAEFEGNETPQWHPAFLANCANYSALRFSDWGRTEIKHDVTNSSVVASSSNTVTLASSASAMDDAYNGMVITTATGWERHMISGYDGASRTVTIADTFVTPPVVGTSYYIQEFQPHEWSQRTLPGCYRQNDYMAGASAEVMVDLCNITGSSPWFCMPSAASDDYVRQFARYVRDNLNPALKVYIEYSRETWNAVYPGFDWCTAMGRQMGINGCEYHAYRATQMFKVWDDVFGEPYLRADRSCSRLVRILAAQAGNPWTGTTMMNYGGAGLGAQAPNPFALGKAAKDYADALTVGFYFGGSIPQASYSTLNIDDLLDLCEADIAAQLGSGGFIHTNLANARAQGLDLLIYEGGQHLITFTPVDESKIPYLIGTARAADSTTIQLSTSASASEDAYNDRVLVITSGIGINQARTIIDYAGATKTATVDSAWDIIPDATSTYLIRTLGQYKQDQMNRSPRMKDLYLQVFNGWRDLGLDSNGKGCKIYCHFLDVQAWTCVGRWGAREYYDEPDSEQPKVRAIKEFAQNNPRWWTDTAITHGDINADGAIDVSDVQTCVNIILGADTDEGHIYQAKQVTDTPAVVADPVTVTNLQAIVNKILGV